LLLDCDGKDRAKIPSTVIRPSASGLLVADAIP
jgi:hypothetical protein